MRPLVIFDLDNTLVDRAAIFDDWAAGFASAQGLDHEPTLAWLRDADDDGFSPRETFFERVRRRFAIDDSVEGLLDQFRTFQTDHFGCRAEVAAALSTLPDAGYALGIATNGSSWQEAKMRAAGLDRLVDGWAVSSLAGFRKPDPRIFALVAERCGSTLDSAWVVGDRPDADIAGAVAIGARSIWIHRGLAWTDWAYAPTFAAASPEEAAHIVLAVDAAAPRR